MKLLSHLNTHEHTPMTLGIYPCIIMLHVDEIHVKVRTTNRHADKMIWYFTWYVRAETASCCFLFYCLSYYCLYFFYLINNLVVIFLYLSYIQFEWCFTIFTDNRQKLSRRGFGLISGEFFFYCSDNMFRGLFLFNVCTYSKYKLI